MGSGGKQLTWLKYWTWWEPQIPTLSGCIVGSRQVPHKTHTLQWYECPSAWWFGDNLEIWTICPCTLTEWSRAGSGGSECGGKSLSNFICTVGLLMPREKSWKESVQGRGKAERERGGQTNCSQNSHTGLEDFMGIHTPRRSTSCPNYVSTLLLTILPSVLQVSGDLAKWGFPRLGTLEYPIHSSTSLSLCLNYADTAHRMLVISYAQKLSFPSLMTILNATFSMKSFLSPPPRNPSFFLNHFSHTLCYVYLCSCLIFPGINSFRARISS